MKKPAIILSAVLLVGGLAAVAAIDGRHEVHGAESDIPPFLKGRVEVEIRNGVYTYRIFNNEPQQFIYVFHLDIKETPITVVATPPGWKPETDGKTYVGWFTEDQASMLPPHGSLGGFQIRGPTTNSVTTPYSLVGWNPTLEKPGEVTVGVVASPAN
jgi:hypothetical protein